MAVSVGEGAAAPVVLGLDFGGTKVAAAVCSLSGECLGTSLVATGRDEGAAVVLERAASNGRALLDGTGSGARLAAVGVATIGIPRKERVELAPAIAGWEGLALGATLEERFGVPVRAANDVKAAAAAEARFGALAGADPGVYLNLGTGLGAAVVVGGQVVAGAHGAAGEVGYNLVGLSGLGVAIGERPMLEDSVSGIGLAAAGSRLLGRPVTAEEVFDRASAGDEQLDDLVSALVAELSLHLVNLVNAIDPARIAVGGGMVRSFDRLTGPIEAALKTGTPFPPELVLAARPLDAALVGAALLGFEAAGAPAPGRLRWTGGEVLEVPVRRPGKAGATEDERGARG